MPIIEIVSDFVCPWCYIGTRRLAAAIELVRREIPDFDCEKRWRPFFLNPNTPPEGEPYLPFLIAKFGSRERVEALFEHVRAAGLAYGLDYAFEKIALRANTLDAHRLVAWAQAQGSAEPLVERIFLAQFRHGEYIGDRGVLTRLAAEAGFDAAAVAAFLASGEAEGEVRALEGEVRAAGIAMVPTFIVDRRQIVVGAEEPAVLAAAMRAAIS